MSLLQKVQSKYNVVAKEDNKLADQVLKLASDLAELGYDDETEKNLLGILEKTYNAVQANCVTADVAWDKIVKQNQAKKLRMKQEMKDRNKRTLEQVKKGGDKWSKLDEEEQQKQKPVFEEKKKAVKQKVAKDIEKIGNLVKVDFSAAKPKAPNAPKRGDETDEDFGNRMNRIRNSLQKINNLMSELRKQAQENSKQEQKTKLKSV